MADYAFGSLRATRRHAAPIASLLKVICPSGVVPIFLSSLISDFPKNIFCSHLPQINSRTLAVPPHRGAYRDRHERGMGCGGRGSVLRAKGLQGGLKDL
jgi:hypothetical protein